MELVNSLSTFTESFVSFVNPFEKIQLGSLRPAETVRTYVRRYRYSSASNLFATIYVAKDAWQQNGAGPFSIWSTVHQKPVTWQIKLTFVYTILRNATVLRSTQLQLWITSSVFAQVWSYFVSYKITMTESIYLIRMAWGMPKIWVTCA